MKYAIIESGGKQYRAVEGDAIEVDRLPIPAGEEVELEKVLLLVDGENITVGKPTVKDMHVFAKVAEHIKGPKVVIFKYSPKKRIRVKTGHRQNYTRLQIEQIGSVKAAKVEGPVEVEQPVLAEERVVTPVVTVKTTAKEKAAKTPAARKEKAPAETKATKPAKISKATAEKKATKPAKSSEKDAEKKATKSGKTSKAAAEKKATKATKTPKAPAVKKPTKPASTSKTPANKKATKTTKTTTASKSQKPEKKEK